MQGTLLYKSGNEFVSLLITSLGFKSVCVRERERQRQRQ